MDYLEKIAEEAFYDELNMMEKEAGNWFKTGKSIANRAIGAFKKDGVSGVVNSIGRSGRALKTGSKNVARHKYIAKGGKVAGSAPKLQQTNGNFIGGVASGPSSNVFNRQVNGGWGTVINNTQQAAQQVAGAPSRKWMGYAAAGLGGAALVGNSNYRRPIVNRYG